MTTYSRTLRLKKILPFLATIITIGLSFNISYAEQFKTNITHPGLADTQVFKMNSNNSHKLVFYNGKFEGKYVSGYYRSAHFLGWTNNEFDPVTRGDANQARGILSVVDGPANNTVVLSYVNNIGQFLSSSVDGKSWNTKQILAPNNYFDKLVSTQAGGMPRVVAYGKSQLVFFSSNDSSNWLQWPMPSGCHNTVNCTFENNDFGDFGNYFTVLQSTNSMGIKDAKLYITGNLQNWYYKNLPFATQNIQKVFHSNNTLSASVVDNDGNQKLWLTPDLDNWISFDLPKDAKLTDLLVHNSNRVDLLLVSAVSAESKPSNPTLPANLTDLFKTNYVQLDPETKLLTVVKTFDGEVTSLRVLDNKLYLTGTFMNIDDNNSHTIVASSSL